MVSWTLSKVPEAKYACSPEVPVNPPRLLFVELLVSLKTFVPTSNDGLEGTFGSGMKNVPITVPTSSDTNLTSITSASAVTPLSLIPVLINQVNAD